MQKRVLFSCKLYLDLLYNSGLLIYSRIEFEEIHSRYLSEIFYICNYNTHINVSSKQLKM